VLEVLLIVTAAAIPAAAAAGASTAATGILGACVTALVGLRQLTGWRESWVRSSRTRLATEQEVAAWVARVPPYDTGAATQRLVEAASRLADDEADRWAVMRRHDRQPPDSRPE
jgi:hypothetical protein